MGLHRHNIWNTIHSKRWFCQTHLDLGEREEMEFDVVIVGAGPAGLSTAIHLKQLAQQNNNDLSVCVLEKGAEVGSIMYSYSNLFHYNFIKQILML